MVQCGDIGIYKSFKDLLSQYINDWKVSDKCERTRSGNPKMPSETVVSQWVSQSWKSIPQSVIVNSISRSGFDANTNNWHIARHDVYGAAFLEAWNEADMIDVTDALEDLSIGAYFR